MSKYEEIIRNSKLPAKKTKISDQETQLYSKQDLENARTSVKNLMERIIEHLGCGRSIIHYLDLLENNIIVVKPDEPPPVLFNLDRKTWAIGLQIEFTKKV